jgi:hypothetical protein
VCPFFIPALPYQLSPDLFEPDPGVRSAQAKNKDTKQEHSKDNHANEHKQYISHPSFQ